jgi:beta-N-acetylhexosaminidase
MRTRWLVSAVVAVAVVVVVGIWRFAGDSSTPAPQAQPAPSPSQLPSSPPKESSPPPAKPDCVATTVAGLDLDAQVGQLLMIGTPIADPDSLADTVRKYHLGGVFLAGRSTRTAAALRSDIAGLQRAAGDLPLLIALDQEGGDVQTLKGPDFPIVPSAVTQGTWSATTLRDRTADEAKRLAAIGVNLNLAPVADTVPTSIGRANPPIGAFKREFGSTPDKVTAAIRTVVPASQNAGVLTTLKHFPGLGRVRANTDTSTKAVDNTTTASDEYLDPFAAGIKAGTAAVMVSSAHYPKLDAKAVAAFSEPIVTGLLRDKLGFQGLVMSDDLGAASAVATVRVGERAVLFVGAGGDVALTIRPQDAAPMANALVAAAKGSPAFAKRVSSAATHVLQAKYRAGLLRCPSSG